MSGNLGRAVIDIAGDLGPLKVSFAQAQGIANKSTAEIGASTRSAFGEVGAAIGSVASTFGVTLGLLALKTFASSAIEASSATTESLNKMQVVFGATSDVVQTFAQDATTKLGMSRQAAYEAIGTFGNLFTSMGVGQEKASQMSTGLVQLAADLGSFNNIDPTLALEKLRSGIVGEAEPLRALGINITAAATEAKALELGLLSAGQTMDTQTAVAARYALIMEQSANAQGDFARTADGLANSSRIAAGEFENLKANLGKLVEKPYTVVVHFMAETLGQVNEILESTPEQQNLYLAESRVKAAQQRLAEAEAGLSKAAAEGTYLSGRVEDWQNDIDQYKADLVDAQIALQQLNGTLGETSFNDWGDAGVAAALHVRDAALDAWGAMQEAGNAAIAMAEQANIAAAAALGAAVGTMQKEIGISADLIGPTRLEADTYSGRAKLAAIREQEQEERSANTRVANDWASKMNQAADTFGNYFQNAVDTARNAAKGLFDLTGGANGKGPFEPGANGPFENLFRMEDVAKLGEASPWQKQLGVSQEQATEISRKFQQGIMDESVKSFIDMPKLVDMAQTEALAKSLKEKFVADLAKQSGANQDVISAMLGFGTTGAAKGQGEAAAKVKVPDLGPVIPSVLAGFDNALLAADKDVRGSGAKFWDKWGEGLVEQAKSTGVLWTAVNTMVQQALAAELQ